MERWNAVMTDAMFQQERGEAPPRRSEVGRRVRLMQEYGRVPSTVVGARGPVERVDRSSGRTSSAAVAQKTATSAPLAVGKRLPQPEWRAPWKLYRVISGHLGWVRCVSVDPSNGWFCTGSADRTIKVWDLATGELRLTLTGHIHAVRDVVVSKRHPYLFSVGEDKMVKCWDLTQNKVIRHYHGHLSGVYACAVHPELDVLVTGGRDSTARVWDMRSKQQVHVLSGHKSTVAAVQCQATEPQVITGSHDATVRLWDLAAGKTRSVLTHHKKSVRALALHPTENTFCSASPDSIKVWKSPEGMFLRSIMGHDSLVNTISLNEDGMLVSGGDDGTIKMWDHKTGYNFQTIHSRPQSGSLESEAGIFASAFDMTGSRLITCEADKTIKMYKEDTSATPDAFPIDLAQLRRQHHQQY